MKKVFINVDSQGHLIEPGDTIIWIADPSKWCRFQRVGRVTSNWDPESRTITALANDSLGRTTRLSTCMMEDRQYDPELEVFYNPNDPAMKKYIDRRQARKRNTSWYGEDRTEDWFKVRVWPRIVTLKDKF